MRIIALLFSGNAAHSAILFCRNLIVASLLDIENYGIVAALAIMMSLIEMVYEIGLQQFVVQTRNGDLAKLQNGIHLFVLLRGVILALGIFACAGQLSSFFGIRTDIWAFQALSIVPVIRAFEHFGVHKAHRDMRFMPLIICRVSSSLISTLSIFPLYYVFGNYEIIVWAFFIQWIVYVIFSHKVSEEKYRLQYAPEVFWDILKFSTPLLINGAVIFAVMQGEKLVIGSNFGIEELAIISMGFTLTLTPTLVLSNSLNQFFLPQLSRIAAKCSVEFDELSSASIQASLMAGLLACAALSYSLPMLIPLVLGAKFSDLVPLVALLALMQAVRLFRIGPTVPAIARAQTSTPVISNLSRASAIPIAVFLVNQGGSIEQILWVGVFGEVLGYIVVLYLAKTRAQVSIRPNLIPFICSFLILICIYLGVAWSSSGDEFTHVGIVFLTIILLGLTIWKMPQLRSLFSPPRV